MGLNQITQRKLSYLERGQNSNPEPELLEQVARLYEVTYEYVLAEWVKDKYGIDPSRLAMTDTRPVAIEGFEAIPLMSSKIAAGSPLVIERDPDRDTNLAFREDFVRKFTKPICFHLGPKERSMEPTIQPGDVVVVDQNVEKRTKPKAGRIFAVNFGALGETPGGAVKRVEIDTERELMLISSENPDKANPYYATRAFDVHDKRLQDILVGEVVWFGRYVVSKGKWW